MSARMPIVLFCALPGVGLALPIQALHSLTTQVTTFSSTLDKHRFVHMR